MGDNLECDNCGKDAIHLISTGGNLKVMCWHCHMLKNPPTAYVEVTKEMMHYEMYCRHSKETDHHVGLKMLSICGWFIRTIENRRNSNVYLVTLEYHGHRNCGRISTNVKKKYFMASGQQCGNFYCGNGPNII